MLGFLQASTCCVQECCLLEVRAKYFSIEIKTVFQVFLAAISQNREVLKNVFSLAQLKSIKPDWFNIQHNTFDLQADKL